MSPEIELQVIKLWHVHRVAQLIQTIIATWSKRSTKRWYILAEEADHGLNNFLGVIVKSKH